MNFRLACKKFNRLHLESRDRALSPSEELFVDAHSHQCVACQQLSSTGDQAFSMLRELSVEVEVSDSLTKRIVRRVKVGNVRDSFRFWSPALAGLAIGLFLMLGVFQMLSGPSSLPTVRPFGEAKRSADQVPIIPALNSATDSRP